MRIINYINVSLDIFCCIISLIILVCVTMAEYRRDKLNKIFIFILCNNCLVMLLGAGICILEGKPGMNNHIYIEVAYFFTFALDPILLTAFTYYLYVFIKRKTTITKFTKYIACAIVAICVIDLILIIISQWNNMIYYIDDNNFWRSNNWYWLCLILPILIFILNISIIIVKRKSLNRRELVILSSYIILPVIALILLTIFVGFAVKNFAITLVTLIFYVGVQSEQAKQLKVKELELSENRIAIMLRQIQPHFIYNSLVVIKQLCDIDPQKAKEATVEFSNYLRVNLDSLMTKQNIPFEKELEHVQTYLSLEKKRFGDKLNVEYNVRSREFVLPCLTLQPIVENAIYHGITRKEYGGTVLISTEEKGKYIVITVKDDGEGFDINQFKNDGRSHVGIENVRARLAAMCGGELIIKSNKGIGTTVEIIIPS